MDSFILYTILFVALTFVAWLMRRIRGTKTVYLILMLGIMCFMASFRAYHIGNDTEAYFRFFSNIVRGDFETDSRLEIGFRYLNRGVALLTGNFTALLAISSVIMFSALFFYVRRWGYSVYTYALLFWLFGFVSFVSPLRQSLAIVCIFISLHYLLKRKYLIAVIICALGALFHKTALVGLLLIPLSFIKPSSLNLFAASAVVLVLAVTGVLESFLDEYYERYLDVQSGVAAALFNAAFGVIPLVLQGKYKVKRPDQRLIVIRWGSCLFAICYLLSLISSGMGRIAYYYFPMAISCWCIAIKKMKPGVREVVLISVILILVVYRILILAYRPQWNSFFPFEYVWQVPAELS